MAKWRTAINFCSIPELSLRAKVALMIVVPMLAVLSISTFLSYYSQRSRTLASMSLLASQTGNMIEHVIESDWLASDFNSIQQTLDSIASDERIRTLILLNPSGKIIYAPQQEGVGVQLDNQSESCQPCHTYEPDERPSGIVVALQDGSRVFRSMHPIENRPECAACHPADQRLIGLLLTDFSISPIENAIAADLRSNLTWWAGTVIVTGLLASLAINRWVLRRLDTLVQAMEAVGLRGFVTELSETPDDAIGRLSAAFNEMAGRVRRRERENSELSQALEVRVEERGRLLERLILAQEEERMRVARELHDDLGQELTSTALALETAHRELERDPSLASRHLERAEELIGEASERMDGLIMGLRPSILDDLGLVPALRAHAERIFDGSTIRWDIRSLGMEVRLPEAVETTLFRVSQEAMTNTLKHSAARHLFIRIQLQDGCVHAEIEDDGVGFDAAATWRNPGENQAWGLIGMRERIDQLDGEFAIETDPERGTKISMTLPLNGNSDG